MMRFFLCLSLLISSTAFADSLDCALRDSRGEVLLKSSERIPQSGFIEAFAQNSEYGFISAYHQGRISYGMIFRRAGGQTARALAVSTTADPQSVDVRLSFVGDFLLQCKRTER